MSATEFSTNNVSLGVEDFEFSVKKQDVGHHKLCVQRLRQPNVHYLYHTFQTKRGHFNNFVILESRYKRRRSDSMKCREEEEEWEK